MIGTDRAHLAIFGMSLETILDAKEANQFVFLIIFMLFWCFSAVFSILDG